MIKSKVLKSINPFCVTLMCLIFYQVSKYQIVVPFQLFQISFEMGEWLSGLRRYGRNQKVPGSNPTRCTTGVKDPALV